jgi:hypothetical protein
MVVFSARFGLMIFFGRFKSRRHCGLGDTPDPLTDILCRLPNTLGGQTFRLRLPSSFIVNFADGRLRGVEPFGCGSLDQTLRGRTGIAD